MSKNSKFEFTFANLENELAIAKNSGFKFITCHEFVQRNHKECNEKIIIFRVDIDLSLQKTKLLLRIFKKLGIKASFFLRLHAKEYNPFSFENYLIIKEIILDGHELGYHTENIDQSRIWNESAEKCLKRDINLLNNYFDIEIKGSASHGGMSGWNNLDFWKEKSAADFNLVYEAYDFFDDVFYLSDSEWTQWKCYDKGNLVLGDTRSLSEHIDDKKNLIYLLIHPETYFERHCYE